jgi:hypothetical protein
VTRNSAQVTRHKFRYRRPISVTYPFAPFPTIGAGPCAESRLTGMALIDLLATCAQKDFRAHPERAGARHHAVLDRAPPAPYQRLARPVLAAHPSIGQRLAGVARTR